MSENNFKVYSNSPVILWEDMGPYRVIALAYTPAPLRRAGQMTTHLKEWLQIHDDKPVMLVLAPDEDVISFDDLKKFYESFGFEFNEDGLGVWLPEKK